MNTLLRCSRLIQFVRHGSREAGKHRRRNSRKLPLPQKATDKIQMWRTMLQHEINEHLDTRKAIKNLKFKSFNVDPTGGNLIELEFPKSASNDVEAMKHHFRRGTWIDLTVGDEELQGFFIKYIPNGIQLRIKDVPPNSIYHKSDISVSLPDDRYVLDFLMEYWDTDWRKSRGYKNFLRAHRAPGTEFTYGRGGRCLEFVNKNLNDSQKHSVQLAMHPLQTLLSIQGPPGTGKTDVVVEIVMQNFRRDKNILVLAPSNKSVDNIAERVHKQMNSNEGHYRLTGNEIPTTPFALQDAINSHQRFGNLEQACGRGTFYWKDEKMGPRNARIARDLHESICTDLFSQANVLYATLTASSLRKLKQRKFRPDLVVIDEAGQAPEVLAWFAIMLAKKAIVVGDQRQLGPVIRSDQARATNFGNTVMDYLEKEFGSQIQTRLQIQYRSNEKIMSWSNKMFYGGELKADESVKNICLEDIVIPNEDCYTEPLVMMDTLNAGPSYHEVRVQTSYKNPGEAKIVEKQVRSLIQSGLDPKQIGVITPYRAQASLIKEYLADIQDLVISSVDGFQGREREVIVMSLVRSQQNFIDLGFLTDMRRMNVSITRAKRQFFIVANSATLGRHELLAKMLQEISRNGRVVKLGDAKRDTVRSATKRRQ